jgi:uncharacterized membrane protein
MWPLIKLVHLAAAVLWLGGIGFMLFALRPAVGLLAPPQRLALVAEALRRFFSIVWVLIGALFASGVAMLLHAGPRDAPPGWHLMMGIGLVMFALFAHLFFAPYRRLRRAVAAGDWPTAGLQMKRIPLIAMAVFVLGWIAIAAMRFVG